MKETFGGTHVRHSLRQMQEHPPHPLNSRSVVDHLPATVSYWDVGQRCRFVNRAYEAWLGIDPNDMLGRTKRELLGPLYANYLPYIEGALRGEQQEFERVLPHATGPRFGLAHYVPDVVDGEVRGFYAVVTDITRFKHAEQTLLDVEARLHAGERISSLTTLAAGIAHEINSPLTAMLAHVDLALEALSETDPDIGMLGADLRAAHDSALRVRDIVHRLRLLAQGDPARDEALDVNDTLERSLDIAGPLLRHRARLTRVLEPGVYVNGSTSQLAQVFVHLLTNAGQALPDHGRETNEIRVATRRDGPRAVVEIADNGCGIPDAVQARIFEPFFTTGPVGAGIGLGLSIANAIVKSFGGTLAVTSRAGEGSTFTIELPSAPAPRARDLRAPYLVDAPHADAVENERPRVLVIDDEPSVTKTLQRVLGRDCDVLVAHHGREAISRLLDRSLPELDVILCDVMMPQPDGESVYAQVGAQRSELTGRFVFMTGGAATQRSRQFLATVAAPILHKPFELKRLRSMISAWAKQSRVARGR